MTFKSKLTKKEKHQKLVKLFECTSNDDLIEVKKILAELGEFINFERNNVSILDLAFKNKNIDIISEFVKYGLNLTKEHRYHQHPLWCGFLNENDLAYFKKAEKICGGQNCDNFYKRNENQDCLYDIGIFEISQNFEIINYLIKNDKISVNSGNKEWPTKRPLENIKSSIVFSILNNILSFKKNKKYKLPIDYKDESERLNFLKLLNDKSANDKSIYNSISGFLGISKNYMNSPSYEASIHSILKRVVSLDYLEFYKYFESEGIITDHIVNSTIGIGDFVSFMCLNYSAEKIFDYLLKQDTILKKNIRKHIINNIEHLFANINAKNIEENYLFKFLEKLDFNLDILTLKDKEQNNLFHYLFDRDENSVNIENIKKIIKKYVLTDKFSKPTTSNATIYQKNLESLIYEPNLNGITPIMFLKNKNQKKAIRLENFLLERKINKTYKTEKNVIKKSKNFL